MLIATRHQHHRSGDKLSAARVNDLRLRPLQYRMGLGWRNVLLLRNHIAMGMRWGVGLCRTPLNRVSVCRVSEFSVSRLLNIVRLGIALVSGLRIAVVLLSLVLGIVMLLGVNGVLGLVVGITLVRVTVVLAVSILVHAITDDSTGGSADQSARNDPSGDFIVFSADQSADHGASDGSATCPHAPIVLCLEERSGCHGDAGEGQEPDFEMHVFLQSVCSTLDSTPNID